MFFTMSKKSKDHRSEQNPAQAEPAEASGHEHEPVEADDQQVYQDTGPEGSLYEQIEQLQQEVTSHRDKHLRTLADMDNLRRRLAREKDEIRRSAAAALIEDMLPSLDNLQIGLETAARHPEAKEVSRGFEVVAAQIRQILERHGLQALEPESGSLFDPNQHEAMAYEASDSIPDHHIVRVLRIGYTLNQRLLRPATVVVSSGIAPQDADNQPEEQN